MYDQGDTDNVPQPTEPYRCRHISMQNIFVAVQWTCMHGLTQGDDFQRISIQWWFLTRNSVAVAHVVAQCTNHCTRRKCNVNAQPTSKKTENRRKMPTRKVENFCQNLSARCTSSTLTSILVETTWAFTHLNPRLVRRWTGTSLKPHWPWREQRPLQRRQWTCGAKGTVRVACWRSEPCHPSLWKVQGLFVVGGGSALEPRDFAAAYAH